MSLLNSLPSNITQNIFKPSEIIGLFNTALARQSVNAHVVYLRGVYLMNQKIGNWAYCYDVLRDEDSQEELTLRLTLQQRENLKNGNLVCVGGLLNRKVDTKGHIQLVLNVSRIEVVQEQAIDEDEIKRIELRQKKSSAGFKNVDSILEQLLYIDQRPQIALVLAQSSITMSDFEAGINAARSSIDFFEYRVNFANSSELTTTLKDIDQKKYTVVAIVRGGGSGIEKLDDLSVLETITNLTTPVIGAIGHVEEKLFIKQLVDKCAPTPNGLGQYFSELVETVSEKKTKSRAALTEKIKKQFKDQLEAGQKQNKELQEKLTALTKIQEESTKKYNAQVEEANKQNKSLQEQLTNLRKAQDEATKKHNDQVEEAHKQNKALQDQLSSIQKGHKEQLDKLNDSQEKLQVQLKSQQEEFNKSLGKMQETNGELQKSLNLINAQNTESQKALEAAKSKTKELQQQLEQALSKGSNNTMLIITVVACIVLFILLIMK